MKKPRTILMCVLACLVSLQFSSAAWAQPKDYGIGLPGLDDEAPAQPPPTDSGQPATPPRKGGGDGTKKADAASAADEDKIKKMIEEAIAASQKKAEEEREKAVAEATASTRTWNKWLPMAERGLYWAIIIGFILWNRRRLDRLSGIFRKYRPWLMQHDERLQRVEEQKALPSPAPPRT